MWKRCYYPQIRISIIKTSSLTSIFSISMVRENAVAQRTHHMDEEPPNSAGIRHFRDESIILLLIGVSARQQFSMTISRICDNLVHHDTAGSGSYDREWSQVQKISDLGVLQWLESRSTRPIYLRTLGSRALRFASDHDSQTPSRPTLELFQQPAQLTCRHSSSPKRTTSAGGLAFSTRSQEAQWLRRFPFLIPSSR